MQNGTIMPELAGSPIDKQRFIIESIMFVFGFWPSWELTEAEVGRCVQIHIDFIQRTQRELFKIYDRE